MLNAEQPPNPTGEPRCPQCGAGPDAVSLTVRLWAQPLGSFSLAGQQMKVSARERPVFSCTACDLCLVGEFEDDHAVFHIERE